MKIIMLDCSLLCFTPLSIILSLRFMLTASQASPVQTVVGSDANFSFLLIEDPGLSVVQIKDKNGIPVINARGSVGNSSNPMYSDRVNFTGNINQKLISFILRNVTLADAGMYNAVSVSGKTIGSQMLVVKASPSKPQIIEFDGPAVNGSDYHLNCFAQSSSEPPNHNLTMLSEWRKDNLTIKPTAQYIVNQTELTITGLNYIQDNKARLVCIAFEDQRAKSVYSGEFIIDVKYGPVNIQVNHLNDVIRERENGQIIVNCTADCNPSCSFQWRKELVPAPLSNNQTLILNNVSKNDTDRYLCYISNNITGISQTAQITIMIIYGPSGAQMMFSSSKLPLKAEENTTVNINCSADCYPDCNYTWSGPRGFFQKGSQLSQIIERDNDGNYTCTATNQLNLGKTATVSATIIVLYGPGNSVNLGSIPPTLGVDLHQMAPSITCNATCNPPCDYRWHQNGTFYRNGATLSLGIVEKATRGNYRCEAYNSVLGVNRSSSTSVNITVYYAPEVLLKPAILPRPSVYILKAGQTNVGLTCVVIDASPPAQQFIWTKDGKEIPTQTSQTFTITNVTKETQGRWGCKGMNSKGNPLESILDVDVHYGPIITNLPNITKVEGDSINVTCVVDSRPDPSSISWTKSQNNTFTQNKSEMYISHLNRADKGTYECTTVNTIQPTGESVGERITVKSSYTLDVTYGARIVNLSVHNYNTVNENSSAMFECLVDSNPPSTITWRRESNNTVLKTESGVVQSLYIINSTECLNMDNYTCSGYNGIQTQAKATIPLFVTCHPRRDFRLDLETKIYRKHHQAAVLRYTVIAYPLPTFTWTFLGNGGENRDLPVSVSQNNSGLQSELWFTSLGIEDFGNYSVIAENSLSPSAREVFEIIPADVKTENSNNLPLPAVAGSISAGVVVILLVVVTLFLWRRCQHRKPDFDDKNERLRPVSGLVDNPVYDSSGPVSGQSVNGGSTGDEYAEVTKPKKKASKVVEPSNIYAQVDRTKKNMKKGAEKGKHGKTSRGDIYENTDLVGKRADRENLYQNSMNAKAEPYGENFYEDTGAAASNGPLKNKDGLHYADLMLDPPTRKNGEDIIRGKENHTEYAEIAYGKRGEPLPESDQEKDNSDTGKHADK